MEGFPKASQGHRVPRLRQAWLAGLISTVVFGLPTVAVAQSQPPPPGAWGNGYTDGGGVGIAGGDGSGSPGARGKTGDGQRASGSNATGSSATTCTAHGVSGPISSKPVPDNVVEAWYTSGGHAPSWAHGYEQPGTFYYVYCGGEYLNVE